MNDAINRSIATQAMRILRVERALVVVTSVLTMLMLGTSLYFEKTYSTAAYSFVILLGAFGFSYACFWLLFSVFKGDFQHRAPKKGSARLALWVASLYIVIASTIAYIVAFSIMGLHMPWAAGPSHELLYDCYFLLAVITIFMARSLAFYMKLRLYILQSLNSLSR